MHIGVHKGVHVREQLGCEWSRGSVGLGRWGALSTGSVTPRFPNHTCSALAFPVSPQEDWGGAEGE